MSNSTAPPSDPLTALLEPIGVQLAQIIERQLARVAPNQHTEPPVWMTKEQAIEYTKLKPGTFRAHVTTGRIPSHGGKSKVYKRVELDRALDAL